jgi:hypothetical protein
LAFKRSQEIGFIKIFWLVELDNSSILEFVAGNLLYCATAFRIASKAGAGVLVLTKSELVQLVDGILFRWNIG